MEKKEKGSLKTRSFIFTLIATIGFIGFFLVMATPILKEQVALLDDKMTLAKIFIGSCLVILISAPIAWRYDDKLKKLEKT